mmetsp:Transcript_28945/g.99788  ORF Transcript_28945/g.99788 Transcript_28945/m.99788 type:complete len:249 (-) Transcript_28945:318-1064(-)
MRWLVAAALLARGCCEAGAAPLLVFITFADPKSIAKYRRTLGNHACYAAKQGYTSVLHVPTMARIKATGCCDRGFTYYKPALLEAWLPRIPEGAYLVWWDADIVMVRPELRFDDLFFTAAGGLAAAVRANKPDVVAQFPLNNAVFAIRNSPDGRTFLAAWRKLCMPPMIRHDFSDNGLFMEQMLRSLRGANSAARPVSGGRCFDGRRLGGGDRVQQDGDQRHGQADDLLRQRDFKGARRFTKAAPLQV